MLNEGLVDWQNLANQFLNGVLFLYSLKKPNNQRFWDVFKGYRKQAMTWNGIALWLTLEWYLRKQDYESEIYTGSCSYQSK